MAARRLVWAAAGGGFVSSAYYKLTGKTEPLFVYYKGETYDVSGFLDAHPGGRDLLLGAVGKDLEVFFEAYTIHKDNKWVAEFLEGMKVEGAKKEYKSFPQSPQAAQEIICSDKRWYSRYLQMLLVVFTLPVWMLFRALYRTSPGPAWLPIATGSNAPQEERPKEVAIIGGGIAGCGAAYALQKAGHKVTVYEARQKLGGNATTFTWSLGGGEYVKTGLAVLALPWKYFRNYAALMNDLAVETVDVKLPFFIRSKVPGYEGDFAQADTVKENSLHETFAKDLEKWDAAVATVRSVNEFFCGQEPSLYSASYWNPMNVITLKNLLSFYGCSQQFWDVIVVSQYGSTFLSPKLDGLPAMILPVIDDLIPLNRVSGSTEDSVMKSWRNTTEPVFSKMTNGCNVKTDSRVVAVNPYAVGKAYKQIVVDSQGDLATYDNVVFACNASAVASMLRSKSWVEEALLRAVSYTDDSDISWMQGYMHQDTSLLPTGWEERICSEYATCVEVSGTTNKAYEQHFTVGSWYPTNQVYGDKKQPLIVSHGIGDKRPHPDKLQGVVTHARAHPDLSTGNLVVSQLMSLVQGRRGIYYCSSYTTPGNGHDLSFLSGLIAAGKIGAPYPFPSNEAAYRDYQRLEALMYPL